MAYILTRPLGASIGDYLSQPKADGGLGLGTTTTSLIFLVAIAVVFQIVFVVDGMPTVIPFHQAVVNDPAYIGDGEPWVRSDGVALCDHAADLLSGHAPLETLD